MIKYIFIFLIIINFANARDYYVNGAIGSDTTATFDASSPSKAYKTINKALGEIAQGDVIIIEGMNKEDRITYNENLIITPDKPFFTIRGINYPIITNNNVNEKVGILVLNSDVRIEGLEFNGFTEGRVSKVNINGGAGIVIKNGNRDAVIANNKFVNCNYGIIANENQSIRIDGNTFNKIEKLSDKPLDGGIGILLMSDGKYIQDNHIGVKVGNTFSEIDNYGILIGNENKLVLADYTKILNNTFQNMKGTGLGIFYVEGIFNVMNNTFDKCNTSIELRGESIDVIISDNTFKGASGDYELLSDDIYPGELLYSIWKGNNNNFSVQLKAVSEENSESVKAFNGKRFISSKESVIKSNTNNQEKILE